MTVLKVSFQAEADEQFQRELYASAVRDGLTGAMRREFFVDRLNAELLFAVQIAAPLALIVWDIDDLGGVNVLYGRFAGDRVVAHVSQAVAAVVRHPAVLGRLGGDRFALISRATSADAAYRTAERLRRSVARAPVRLEHAAVNVTASFGVAVTPVLAASSPADLLRAAETAMRRAKAAGKDGTVGGRVGDSGPFEPGDERGG